MFNFFKKILKREEKVVHPKHYAFGDKRFEPITIMKELKGFDYPSFCIGNALKYIARCDKKGSEIEDLKKAAFYLNDAAGFQNHGALTSLFTTEAIGNSNSFAGMIDDWKQHPTLCKALMEICFYLTQRDYWHLINARNYIQERIDELEAAP